MHLIDHHVLLLLLAIAGAQNSHVVAESDHDSNHHLRIRVHRIADAVAGGQSRSVTFRKLLTDLRTARAVVYIDAGRCKPWNAQPLAGCTAPLAQTKAARYFGVVVDVGLPMDRLIALIGHELQHAVELLSAPATLTNDESLVAWNSRRISAYVYETEQAEAVTRTILKELSVVR